MYLSNHAIVNFDDCYLVDDVFSVRELASIANPIKQSLIAKRLAAKKALNLCLTQLGLETGLKYSDISVLHHPNGAPFFLLESAASMAVSKFSIKHVFLSISDEKTNAYSYVVIQH